MKKRVLVVEDNENNLALERDLLEVAGFEVFTAREAKTGLEIAFREIPDAVIMDVRLPDMRGTEAAKLLRDDKRTRGIPLIFVTASIVGEDLDEIKSMSWCGYISKPINTRTFANAIGKCIDQGLKAPGSG